MRVLVIEDDKKISKFINNGFLQAGFAVDLAYDGKEGLRLALQESYDAAIVDIMLPELDGLSLIEELRRNNINTPVLILSAKLSIDDRVKGLETGGDDYLTKPFSFAELLARIYALIRRSSGVIQNTKLSVGPLSMDVHNHEVFRDDKQIFLQPREFALLEYLMRYAGRPLSKTLIMENVYNYRFDPQTNVIDVLVCRLRNKVDRNFENKMIHTIRGVGYVIKES